MRKVGIHQPNFFPFLGLFDKINDSDIFIYYDDAIFSRGVFMERVKILTPNGTKWIRIPLEQKGFDSYIPLKNLTIDHSHKTSKGIPWNEDILLRLEQYYKKAPYFEKYFGDISDIMRRKPKFFVDLVIPGMEYIMRQFDINTPTLFSSELSKKHNIEPHKTKKLVDLTLAVEGDTYFSGRNGKIYMAENLHLFDEAGLKVEYQDWKPAPYPQVKHKGRPEDFVGYISSLDALFNVGNPFEPKGL